MQEITAAGYTKNTSSDMTSITTLKSILDSSKVIPILSENDKTPNYDGYLEIIDINGIPIGKIEAQVKTHRKKYVSPSFSIKLKLLAYVKDVVQLPFILIAVDQKNKKAFWKEITPENARIYINEALAEKTESYAIQFEKESEISLNPPYDDWRKMIENHKKLLRDSSETNNQLSLSLTELKELKLKLKNGEREESSNYIQMHMFVDKLNNLFTNEFKIIRRLFVSDFWKFGIVTFGKIEGNRIAYSLFTIGWHENLKQIREYQESDNFQDFISNYLSVKAYSNSNPILTRPVKYAYEKLEEYLKLMLDRKLLWPNNQYLKSEFLFHLGDTKFRSPTGEEVDSIDLVLLKEQIEKHLGLIPEEDNKLMRDFPEMNGNLYRALDYIQDFRILGKKSINRLSPSKKSLENITTSVGEKGVFPKSIEKTLFEYWSTLLNSYESILDEFFPLLKEELTIDCYTHIVVPSINSVSFSTANLSVLKISTKTKRARRNLFIEMNQSNVKIDFERRVVAHNEKEYKIVTCSRESIIVSSLIDDMPIRKGVYKLLTENFKKYFEKIKNE